MHTPFTPPVNQVTALGKSLALNTALRELDVGANPTTAAQQFLAQLEPALPGISAKWNGKVTLDAWKGNPWSQGAYAYWRVGQYTEFSGAEGERSGNIHFAGEHTSTDFQGFLNGAVDTGILAAKEILADLRVANALADD